MSKVEFKDRVAIVTGAGGGLGRSHALELARRGVKVVVNDLGGAVDGTGGSSTMAEQVVAEIIATGGEAIANGANVTKLWWLRLSKNGATLIFLSIMRAFYAISLFQK